MTARTGIRPVVAAVLAALVAMLAGAHAASAATWTVNTTADHAFDKLCNAPPAGDCTLRDAVNVANSADDTISIPTKGTYTLNAGLGELLLANDHIVGAGARAVTISGGGGTRIFRAVSGSSTIAGVTLTAGNGVSTVSNGAGGAIFVASEAVLSVASSTIKTNTATTGGGAAVAGTLGLVTSTVSGNTASTGRLSSGGGITVSSAGGAAIVNSTISGNTAVDTAGGAASQGGGIASSGGLAFNGVTITGNTASSGGGLLENITGAAAPPPRQIFNTIIGGNSGGECAGNGFDTDTTHNDLAEDTTCGFGDATDHQSLAPQLGGLANNGGPTDTHALLPASPAINQGGGCGTTDQRGVARPQPAGSVCDIGAFEYRPPTLKVVTTVVNDNGGTLAAGNFFVHVREGGVDVKGGRAPGVAAGRTYTLVAGSSYTVDAEAATGYAFSYSADCNVTLTEGAARTCTVTANDVAPTLKVITQVDNGTTGGGKVPSDFTAHVRQGAADVSGSPQPGTGTGTTYTLDAGTYTISADGVPGYSATVSAPCASNGAVTLAVGDARTCTILLTAGAPRLDVITHVVNDDGGTRTAGSVLAHVRSGGADVVGSPQVGSTTGTTYSLAAGTYAVAANPMTGYAFSYSPDCNVTLQVGDPDRTCTVTANDVAPKLKVVTSVVNDSGGTKTPAAFSVHVRKGGGDVSGSPKPGSASGTTYTLKAGSYAVGTDAVTGYATTISGSCAATGAVTLAPGDVKTCTLRADDKTVQRVLPPPVKGRNVNALPAQGTVKVKLPGSSKFVVIDEGEQIPLGTIVDVTKGRVTIVALPGTDATAVFYGGVFKLGQTKGKKPITVLSLVEKLSCKHSAKKAQTAKKKRKKRRLWGDGHGKFRTKGSFSSATVRGTKWLVEDRCTSTLTRVARGRVAVRDFVKRKTFFVKAGHKYVARRRG